MQVEGESLEWRAPDYSASRGGQMAKVDSPAAVSAQFGFRWREGKLETAPRPWVSLGGWTREICGTAAGARTALTLTLSPGQVHDATEERKLLNRLSL